MNNSTEKYTQLPLDEITIAPNWSMNRSEAHLWMNRQGVFAYQLITNIDTLKDRDLFITLLNSNYKPDSLKCYPQFCDDYEIAELSIPLKFMSLQYLSSRLKNNHKLTIAMLRAGANHIHYIGDDLLDDIDFATDLILLTNKRLLFYTFPYLSRRARHHTGLQFLVLGQFHPKPYGTFIGDRDIYERLTPHGYTIAGASICLRLRGW